MTSHLRTYSGQWQYFMDARTEGKHFLLPQPSPHPDEPKNLTTFLAPISGPGSITHISESNVHIQCPTATAVLAIVHTVVSSCFPCSIVHLYCLFVCFSCCIASAQPNCFHQFFNFLIFYFLHPQIIFSAFLHTN